MEKLTDKELEQELKLLEKQLKFFMEIKERDPPGEHPEIEAAQRQNSELLEKYKKFEDLTEQMAKRLKHRGLGNFSHSAFKTSTDLKQQIDRVFKLYRNRQDHQAKLEVNPHRPTLVTNKTDFGRYKSMNAEQIFANDDDKYESETGPTEAEMNERFPATNHLTRPTLKSIKTAPILEEFNELGHEFVANQVEQIRKEKERKSRISQAIIDRKSRLGKSDTKINENEHLEDLFHQDNESFDDYLYEINPKDTMNKKKSADLRGRSSSASNLRKTQTENLNKKVSIHEVVQHRNSSTNGRDSKLGEDRKSSLNQRNSQNINQESVSQTPKKSTVGTSKIQEPKDFSMTEHLKGGPEIRLRSLNEIFADLKDRKELERLQTLNDRIESENQTKKQLKRIVDRSRSKTAVEKTDKPISQGREKAQTIAVNAAKLEKIKNEIKKATEIETRKKVETLIQTHGRNTILQTILAGESLTERPSNVDKKNSTQAGKMREAKPKKNINPEEHKQCTTFVCYAGLADDCPKSFGPKDPSDFQPNTDERERNNPDSIIDNYLKIKEQNKRKTSEKNEVEKLVNFNKKTHEKSPKKSIFEQNKLDPPKYQKVEIPAPKSPLNPPKPSIAKSPSNPPKPSIPKVEPDPRLQNNIFKTDETPSPKPSVPAPPTPKLKDLEVAPPNKKISSEVRLSKNLTPKRPSENIGRPSHFDPKIAGRINSLKPLVEVPGKRPTLQSSNSFGIKSSGITVSERIIDKNPIQKNSIDKIKNKATFDSGGISALDFTTFSQCAPNTQMLSEIPPEIDIRAMGPATVQQFSGQVQNIKRPTIQFDNSQQIIGETTDSKYLDDSQFFVNEMGLKIPYHVHYQPSVSETVKDYQILERKDTSATTNRHMDIASPGDVNDYIDDLY